MMYGVSVTKMFETSIVDGVANVTMIDEAVVLTNHCYGHRHIHRRNFNARGRDSSSSKVAVAMLRPSSEQHLGLGGVTLPTPVSIEETEASSSSKRPQVVADPKITINGFEAYPLPSLAALVPLQLLVDELLERSFIL
ncbi:uncharacterized protein A4U43_C06F18880 [Asparagus officinalis]|uniref:Uncharacterized protein n=1 Tax=Asparagus officinalis TaxID=4686 RepID=A0A5P1EN04_ASPOF|nr:uncharacterized protein A4U43_C06F18880 [Asparagus officinalis]